MTHELEKLNTTLDASLSDEERSALRADFNAFLDAHPARLPVPSPFAFTLMRHGVSYAFFALVLITVPTAIAAERSLPNDALYSVKTEVIERAALGLVSFSPAAQARLHLALVDRRLSEAEELIAGNVYDDADLDDLAAEAGKSASAVHALVSGTNAEEAVKETGADLETSLEAHGRILDVLASDRTEGRIESFVDDVDALEEKTEDIVDEAPAEAGHEEASGAQYEKASKEASALIAELREALEGTDIAPYSFEEEAAELLNQAEEFYAEAASSTDKAVSLMEEAGGSAEQGLRILSADKRLPDEAEL